MGAARELLPLREADVDAVTGAEARLAAHPWTRGNFVDSLSAGYSGWTCRVEGVLAAYAVLMMAPEEAHLLVIGVLPEFQRQGLASEMLAHLFRVARDNGARRMILEVRPSNVGALGLYRRFLFSEIGRRKGYYPAGAGREDALVLARDL